MQLGKLLGKILRSGRPTSPDSATGGGIASVQSVECGERDEGNATALGVKYTSRFSWQILPPAGWQRHESNNSAPWPASGTSPSVTFTNTALRPGESAMIRWQIAGTPESEESHRQRDRLLSGQEQASVESIHTIHAPGMVSSMKLTEVDRIALPCGLPAIIVSARYLQLKGEEPLMRYVLIFPDRAVKAQYGTSWYRETVQFVATEASFWSNEKLAIESIKTFRRGDGPTTAIEKGFVSGTYPVMPAIGSRL